jgi:glycosyltransferase involved in cell wall biosynthesis
MAGRPVVTIGLPVYNGERYLAAALESHLAQTYDDIKLIISDNASTDATPGICEHYASRDSRIEYVRQPENVGVNRNHQRVFELASSDSPFFRWAGADDLPSPRLIEDMVAILRGNPPVVAVVPDTVNIDATGNVVQRVPRTLDLRTDDTSARVRAIVTRGYQMVHTYGLMRRSTLMQTSRRWHYFGWDFVLLLELALRGQIAQPADAVLYRRHHDRETGRTRSLSAYKAWVDPTLRAKFLLPHWRLSVERLRSVVTCSLSVRQRSAALVWVLRHSWWTRHQLARDIVVSWHTLAGRGDEINF